MTDISRISTAGDSSFRANPIAPAPSEAGRTESAPRIRQADTVNVSQEAKARLASVDEGVRSELVNRVRSELDAGGYVTQDKLDSAVDRLIDDILG